MNAIADILGGDTHQFYFTTVKDKDQRIKQFLSASTLFIKITDHDLSYDHGSKRLKYTAISKTNMPTKYEDVAINFQ
jgi:hypothetical protein